MNKPTNSTNKTILATAGLLAIIALGAFLRFYQLGAYSIGNTYYAAAVKSMLTAWHNFFFVAFEPGGSVTVDKPPLGFWVQAISADIFGVNGFALALPQALAGTLSIAVLYHLVRKYFGIWAGLIAALVLAIAPITVATERNNTIDGLLVFILLLAAWAFLKAIESDKLRHLLLGALLVGLGFNIKMLQAVMPLPAFYAVYFFGTRHPWWKRILQLGLATVVLIVIGLAWVVAVDLTPADQRPYIGSSENNTVLELIIGHNGLSRLGLANRSPRGGTPPRGGRAQPPSQGAAPLDGPSTSSGQPVPGANPPQPALAACAGSFAGQTCTIGLPDRDVDGVCRNNPQGDLVCIPENRPAPNTQPPRPGGGRSGETGMAGVLRLFQEPLVTEMSWLLPLALLGIPVGLAALPCCDEFRPSRERKFWKNGKTLSLLLWAGWLLPAMAYFSFTTGLFHRYYLIMLGPPLAALVGITFWAIDRHLKRNHWVGWLLTAFLTGLTITFEVNIMRNNPQYTMSVTVGTLLLWIGGLGFQILKPLKKIRKVGLGLILLAMLVAPLTWSALTVLNPSPNVALPTAGVEASDQTRATFMTPNQELLDPTGQDILEYTLVNTEPDDYLLATLNARSAAPYILETGRPVLTFGGFTGSDDVIDAAELTELVASGELRFILGLPQGKPEISQWVENNCAVVRLQISEISETSHAFSLRGENNQVLYDCGW